MSTPLVALVMPPLEAAAVLLPILLVQDAFSVFVYRRVWDPWNLKVMLPGCVVGIGAAAFIGTQALNASVTQTINGLYATYGADSWVSFRGARPVDFAGELP